MSKFYTDLMQEIQNMTDAEKRGILHALQDSGKPEPETRVLGPSFSPEKRMDERGLPMTDEEIWDHDHPLIDLWPYGHSLSVTYHGGKTKTKTYSDQEVEEHNQPIQERWLKEKQKLFPDAKLPPVPRI